MELFVLRNLILVKLHHGPVVLVSLGSLVHLDHDLLYDPRRVQATREYIVGLILVSIGFLHFDLN